MMFVVRRQRMLKLDRSVPPGEVPFIGTDGRRTPTSTRRSLKNGGTGSAPYGDPHGRRAAEIICGQYSGPGQPCPASGQWCDHAKHWHRTTSLHPPSELALQRSSDYSATGDRDYFYDVAETGNSGGEFTAGFVDWDLTGSDVMAVGRCHGDESRVTVASEHVYEMAA